MSLLLTVLRALLVVPVATTALGAVAASGAPPALTAPVTTQTDPGGPRSLPTDVDWDYQLGGAAVPAERVGVVVRDRTEEPAGSDYDVCYVNAFQTQPDARAFWRRHADLVLRRGGLPVRDDAWGEWLLDVRTPAHRTALARLTARWVAGCARAGYDAVEYDNLDSFTRSGGLLTRRQALAHARLLVDAAHDVGLAAAQKNLAGLDGTRLGFDLAVAEECGRWDECEEYVEHYGDAVLAVEYRVRDFRAACAVHGGHLAVLLRDRALRPDGRRRWC